MTDCAMCGSCCETIPLGTSLTEYRERYRLGGTMNGSREDLRFILDHFHRISNAEAARRNSRIAGANRYFYECDQYNPETHACMAHEQRPLVCRGFPWYEEEAFGHQGGQRTAHTLLPFPTCSYWADIPREQWPDGVIPLIPVEASTNR